MLRLTCTIPGRGRKAYAFADADGAIVIGSAQDCSVELPPGGCPARALRVDIFNDHLRVTALTDDIAVRVGGKLVAEQASVEHIASASGSFPALAITIGDVHVRADYTPDDDEAAAAPTSSLPPRRVEQPRGVPPSPKPIAVGAARGGSTSKIGTPRVNPDHATTDRPQPAPPSRAASQSTRARHRDMFSTGAQAVESGGLWNDSEESAALAQTILVGEPDVAEVQDRPKSAEFSRDLMTTDERDALAAIAEMKREREGEPDAPPAHAPELPSTAPPPVTTTLADQRGTDARLQPQSPLPATLQSLRDGVGTPSESIPPMPLMSDITPTQPSKPRAGDDGENGEAGEDGVASEPLRVRSSPLASVGERRQLPDEKWADLEGGPLDPTNPTSADADNDAQNDDAPGDDAPEDDGLDDALANDGGPQTAVPGSLESAAAATAESAADANREVDPFDTDAQLIGEYLTTMPTQPMPAVRLPNLTPAQRARASARTATPPPSPGDVAVRVDGETVEHIDLDTALKELGVSQTKLMRAVAAGDVAAIRYGDRTLFRRDEVEQLAISKHMVGKDALPRTLTVSDTGVPAVADEPAVPYESVEFAAMGQSREMAAARSGMLAAVAEGAPPKAERSDGDPHTASADELAAAAEAGKAEQQLNTWFSLPTVSSTRNDAVSPPSGARAARTVSTPSASRASLGPAPMALQRTATVRYHAQMQPFRNYRLTVSIAARDAAGRRTRDLQPSGEPFDTGAAAQVVTVVPRMPGCIVVPDRVHLDLRSQPATAEFWITPTARGNYNREARSLVDGPSMPCAFVEFVRGARHIERIATPTRVVGTWPVRLAALAGIAVPTAVALMRGLGIAPTVDTVGDAAAEWAGTWSPLDPLWTLALVGGGSLLVLAGLLAALLAPREAEPRVVDLKLEQT